MEVVCLRGTKLVWDYLRFVYLRKYRQSTVFNSSVCVFYINILSKRTNHDLFGVGNSRALLLFRCHRNRTKIVSKLAQEIGNTNRTNNFFQIFGRVRMFWVSEWRKNGKQNPIREILTHKDKVWEMQDVAFIFNFYRKQF